MNPTSKVNQLCKLEEDDLFVFYVTLAEWSGNKLNLKIINQYIVGFLTVKEVIVIGVEENQDELIKFLQKHPNIKTVKAYSDSYDELLKNYPAADGLVAFDKDDLLAMDNNLILITGKEPTKLLDRAVLISEYVGGNLPFILLDDLREELELKKGINLTRAPSGHWINNIEGIKKILKIST